MSRMRSLLGVLAVGVLTLGMGSAAQDEGIIATGLLSPRHIAYGPDGTLWIAESGSGGDTVTPSPLGEGRAGLTARITTVSPDGVQEAVADDLPSMNWGFNEIVGVSAVLPVGDLLWVAVGNGGGEATGSLNRGVYVWDSALSDPVQTFDTLSIETTLNPDNEIIDSNPMDLAAGPDGTIYIADAGANTVWQIRPGSGELSVFATWTDNPVPTAVEVDPNGDVWVGFLSGFPHTEGSARVEQRASDGTLKSTFEGYTAIVDLALAGDGLYAVQYGIYGAAGFSPSTGSIVTVSEVGPLPVLESVNYPFGLTLSPDGIWMIAFDTNHGQAPGLGRVGSAEAVAASDVPAPVATPEIVPVETPEVTQ